MELSFWIAAIIDLPPFLIKTSRRWRGRRSKRVACTGLHLARHGTYKSFEMPWEGHALQFRWEVFNVTNTQRFDGLTTSTQAPLNETKAGRIMQFALRYTF